MNITILNIFIVIINALICIKLNTTQTIVLNNWLAYVWKLSLTILTAISISFYLGLVMVRETLVSNQASQDILTAEQANALIVKEQLVSLTKVLHIVITSLGIEIPTLYAIKEACEMTKTILNNFDAQVFKTFVISSQEHFILIKIKDETY